MSFICHICNEEHELADISFGSDAPEQWSVLTDDEQRGSDLSSDQCVLEADHERHFFVRACLERKSSGSTVGVLYCSFGRSVGAVEACQPGENRPCAVRYEAPSCSFSDVFPGSPWPDLNLAERCTSPSVPRVELAQRRSKWFLVDRRTGHRLLSMPERGNDFRLEEQRECDGRLYVIVSGEGGEIERTEVLFTLPAARVGRRR
jgi:hypothetical protein